MMTISNDNNKKLLHLKERHIATVSDRIHYGKDMQADDKYIVLEPGKNLVMVFLMDMMHHYLWQIQQNLEN